MIPADIIQTIKVSKAVTANIDALSGSVNLISRTSPQRFRLSATVGRKSGPLENYLCQDKIEAQTSPPVKLEMVRKSGKFSCETEIEALAVDDENGFVYYSHEGRCIRKYHTEAVKGNAEIPYFFREYFLENIEGIGLTVYPNGEGYLIVSNQQLVELNIFSRKIIPLPRRST